MNHNTPKVHTMLFTEECPLKCNYCNLRAQEAWGQFAGYTKEDFFAELKANEDADIIQFTGGEPFTHWHWIKEAIEKYGHHFRYSFNTCGYLCTEEQLEFLSRYNTTLYLSVDGPRRIAMWRRPNAYNNKYDYWDKLEKIIPAILFYFPQTPWKSIISKRIIPFVPEIYAAASSYGFKRVHFEMDFEEQPWRAGRGEAWTKENYKDYQLAIDVILTMMVDSFSHGAVPPLEINMEKFIIQSLKQDLKPFSINSVNCGIAAKRDISSVYVREAGSCMGEVIKQKNCSLDDIFKEIESKYKDGCEHDKNCSFFDYCARFACLKDNWTCTGNFLTPSQEWCENIKIFGGAAIKLLTIGNEFLAEENSYQQFLLSMYQQGGGRG